MSRPADFGLLILLIICVGILCIVGKSFIAQSAPDPMGGLIERLDIDTGSTRTITESVRWATPEEYWGNPLPFG